MTSPTDLAPQLVGEWEGSQGRGRVGGGNRVWLRKGLTEDRRELEQEGQGQTGGQAVEWAVEWLVRECELQLYSEKWRGAQERIELGKWEVELERKLHEL